MIANKLLGDSGEHYVAYRLARMGINPALLSRNSKGVDILATDDGNKVVSIQVKTSAGRTTPRQWDVGKHCPKPNKYFFYIFLNLWDDEDKDIEFFIIPSQYVYDNVKWTMQRPQFKICREDENKYLNKWNLISEVFFNQKVS